MVNMREVTAGTYEISLDGRIVAYCPDVEDARIVAGALAFLDEVWAHPDTCENPLCVVHGARIN